MNTDVAKTTKILKPIPVAPAGVKYALAVPQSVLFADLSLQGNLRKYFIEAMNINFEPAYIAIDAGGAMSWNYDDDADFNNAFLQDRTIGEAVSQFISSMGTTARKLDRRSSIGSDTIRRNGNTDDILNDLIEYWHSYKLHMTSLFTFWNVEALLGQAIKDEATACGINPNNTELDQLIRSNETNQFLRERRTFAKIVERFAGDKHINTANASPELLAALDHHIKEFSFLLTPFNLGEKPEPAILLERVTEAQNTPKPVNEPEPITSFTDTNPHLRKLIGLLQQLTFWKNERLDVLSMADARVELLYQAVASVLGVSIDIVFAMTCAEIEQSLVTRNLIVDGSVLAERAKAYCLVLNNGKIDFYKPSVRLAEPTKPKADIGTVLYGVVASKGLVTGKVRIIENEKDLKYIEAGDILVAKMTRPEFGAALDKAAAFVTDEGGLLCHAAIISREMGKPCITNTQFGSKLLHSGMNVTVDANNGFVIIDSL